MKPPKEARQARAAKSPRALERETAEGCEEDQQTSDLRGITAGEEREHAARAEGARRRARGTRGDERRAATGAARSASYSERVSRGETPPPRVRRRKAPERSDAKGATATPLCPSVARAGAERLRGRGAGRVRDARDQERARPA